MPDRSRVLASRIGGLVTRPRHEPMEYTKAAREASRTALDRRLLADIDERAPDITDRERATCLEAARSAHFARMSRKGLRTRRRNARREQRAQERRAEARAARAAGWAERDD